MRRTGMGQHRRSGGRGDPPPSAPLARRQRPARPWTWQPRPVRLAAPAHAYTPPPMTPFAFLKPILTALVLPPASLTALLMLGLWLGTRRRRLGRFLVGLSLASLWMLSTPVAATWIQSRLLQPCATPARLNRLETGMARRTRDDRDPGRRPEALVARARGPLPLNETSMARS